jgi:serine/threonine-protein kinase
MPAPPSPAPPEIELDLDDLVAEDERLTTSQTRRLAANGGPDAPAPPASHEARRAISNPDARPVGKPYLAGDLIDTKHRLTRIIGRGGMGSVWQAHNLPLDIDVAIKLIRRDRTAPGTPDRLLTEARAVARLVHPAIVRIFDFGETEQGDPFIVMELLQGESLHAILRRKKRLTPAVAVQMMLPVAHALASAHNKGIVHRDLKPDNIIVVSDETGVLVPKIVDFGIAKLLSPDLDRHMTMAGEVLGSPDYMSPEQASGAEKIGAATDIWTFSVVLYELVTGRRPFDGANYNALIASIRTATPAPITAHGVGDAALAGIIEHGLAKDPGSRWPHIRELGAALASWAVGQGIEDDVMGNPIAKQWLSGAARRLLTVLPESGGAALRSGPVEPPAPPSWSAPSLTPPPPALTPPPPPSAPPSTRPVSAPALVAPTFTETPRASTPSLAPLTPPIDRRRASARRALLLTIGIVLVGAVAVSLLLLREGTASDPSASESASATASAPAENPTTPPTSDAPSATASASAQASSSAATVPTGRPLPFKAPRRNKALPAPKNKRY